MDSIRRALDVHLSLPEFSIPHIRLPHFSMSGNFNPETHEVPSVHVDWYGKGGFPGFDGGARLFVAGERGGEFVWPSYSPYIERYADALADSMEQKGRGDTRNEWNIYANDPELVARVVENRQRRLALAY
ncbi:MAG: hypothetical protein IKG69_12005, partial [Atopobiaceae bacterium]|nr:hypothetical protein [Atopobiaceae bacterium]